MNEDPLKHMLEAVENYERDPSLAIPLDEVSDLENLITHVYWKEVKAGVYVSNKGKILHKKKGWFWYKLGEKAGQEGPFLSISLAKKFVNDAFKEKIDKDE